MQILLGVLRVSSRRSSLQLQDSSGTLPCVISHRDSSPFANTALIGMFHRTKFEGAEIVVLCHPAPKQGRKDLV